VSAALEEYAPALVGNGTTERTSPVSGRRLSASAPPGVGNLTATEAAGTFTVFDEELFDESL
jgi:hypothetical protein